MRYTTYLFECAHWSKVDKAVKAFDALKVGDAVHARYREAIAISVQTS